jgi:hypothetical protein
MKMNRNIYRVEIASASEVDRNDETYPSDNWESVASGNSYEEVLEYLLRNANSEEFDISNSWLRLVIEKGDKVEVINY